MKAVKFIIALLAALLALIVVGIGIFLLVPAIQKPLVQAGLSAAGMRSQIDEIDIDLNGVTARDVNVLSDTGPSFAVADLDVRFSPTALLAGDIVVNRLTATGVNVDLSQLEPQPEAETEEMDLDLAEIFKPLSQRHIKLVADDITLEGRVALPEGNSATFDFSGGGIAPGKTGTLQGHAQLVLGGEMAKQVQTVQLKQELSIVQDDGGITAVNGTSEAAVEGPAVGRGAGIRLAFDVEPSENEGQLARLRVATLQGKELASFDATSSEDGEDLSMAYQLDASQADVSALGVTAVVPSFAVHGSGRGTFNTESKSGKANGSLSGTVIPAEGQAPAAFSLTYEASADEDSLTLATLNATASSDGNQLVSVSLPQALTVRYDDPIASLADRGQLLSVSLDAPLAPFLKMEGAKVTSGRLVGSLALVSTADGLRVDTEEPIGIEGLSLTRPGQPTISNLNLGFRPQLEVVGEDATFSLADLSGSIDGQRFLEGSVSGKAELENDPEGTFQTSLTLSLTPIYAVFMPGAEGEQGQLQLKGDGSFDAEGDDLLKAKLSARLAGISAPGGSPMELSADVKLAVDDSGAIEATVPVTLTGPMGKSDLELEAAVNTEQVPLRFSARVSGDTIYVPDFQALAAVYTPATAQEEAEDTPAPAPGGPDREPLWSGVTGSAEADIDNVVLGEQTLKDLEARIIVDSDRVELEKLSARLGDEVASGHFKLAFDASQAQSPYSLTGEFQLPNFDLAAADTALRGNDEAQMIEGQLDVRAQVSGTGPNLETVAQWVNAAVDVDGANVVYHPLGNIGINDQGLFQKLGSSGAIGSLLGDKLGGGAATAVQEVLSLLSGVQANELALKASVKEGLKVDIDTFRVLSPQILFNGSGALRYDPSKSLLNQPFTLKLQIGAKGNAARAFDKLGLLEGALDNTSSNYVQGPTFTQEGTLADYSSSLLGLVKQSATAYLAERVTKGGQTPEKEQAAQDGASAERSGKRDRRREDIGQAINILQGIMKSAKEEKEPSEPASSGQ